MKTKFYAVIAAVLFVLFGLFLLGSLGFNTLSGVRAWVGAEGLWTRGQKEASYHLDRYAMVGGETEYQEYLDGINVPLEMKAVRLEFEKPDQNIDVIRRGLTGGGVHPSDVRQMVLLFDRFRSVEYIERALDIWASADALIAELESLGAGIHRGVVAGDASASELMALAEAIGPIHHELDLLEKEFSSTLGEAARWAQGLLLRVMLGFALLGAAVCLVGLLLVTRINTNLQQYSLDLAEQNRKREGENELHERMQGQLNLTQSLDDIISFLAQFLNAQIGTIYLMKDGDTLELVSDYAFANADRVPSKIKIGEGIVGQVAREKKSKNLVGIPDDYMLINSALGKTPPRNIFVFPLVFEGRVKAVIELGSIHEFEVENIRFLEGVADTIAVFIHGVQAHERVEELLQQSQQLSEELEAQQEELRQTNEELEAQASSLEESEERLRGQQAELEESNAALEEKSLDLEAAHEAIEEKARNLESASRYKSEFLANMSHELRTPLNSILLLSNLLTKNKEENLTEKQVEFVRTIGAAGKDLLGLINEVLDLAKIESGKMDLLVENVDLPAFLSVLESNFKETAVEKGLEFSASFVPGVPTSIRTDEQRLGQIVKNLLSNAFKFTEEGSVAVKVECPDVDAPFYREQTLPQGSLIAINVIDSGIGIPDEQREHVFKAFRQAEGSTNRKFGGTGLGLSICRELATILGGQVLLDSVVGQGSRFAVVLPVEISAVTEQKETTPPEEPLEVEVQEEPTTQEEGDRSGSSDVQDDRDELQPGDRSLLIVEDDAAFAGVLQELAHERGFKCLVAEDGRTGLQLADYYLPSGVLLDIGLPDIDGMSIMERLKENLKTRHIPVHVISGDPRKFEALKRGAVGFLPKPVNVEQLDEAFSKIETLVSRPVKQLLLTVDDDVSRKHLLELIGEKDVEITDVPTAEAALNQLKTQTFDCMVLDAGLPGAGGVALLKKIRSSTEYSQIPVVVFAAEDLSSDERLTLDRYADRIVINDSNYSERLLDETALFLHRVEKDLPEEKRRMIRTLHDRGAIFRDKKVLITDDDMRNVFALSSILEEREIKTVVAKDGYESLERLDDTPDIDLVLMDIMMPGMDGYEAMTKIRAKHRFKSLPIIALTAKAMRGDRAKCIEAGASDYLAKPVDTERLLSMLRVWLYK